MTQDFLRHFLININKPPKYKLSSVKSNTQQGECEGDKVPPQIR